MAGKWGNKSTGKKTSTVNVPVDQIPNFVQPSFQVYQDENAAQFTLHMPHANNILKEWKSEAITKEEDHIPLFIAEPFDPLVQPQYDKWRVYQGTEEFSFEELRAIKYFKDLEEDKRKEEKAEVNEANMKAQQLQEELEKKNSEISSMKEMLAKHEAMLAKLLSGQQNAVNIQASVAEAPTALPLAQPSAMSLGQPPALSLVQPSALPQGSSDPASLFSTCSAMAAKTQPAVSVLSFIVGMTWKYRKWQLMEDVKGMWCTE